MGRTQDELLSLSLSLSLSLPGRTPRAAKENEAKEGWTVLLLEGAVAVSRVANGAKACCA